MINEIPTAFPWMHKDITCTGMTLRDYFAARAMQDFMTSRDTLEYEDIAQFSYELADAMIKARGQE